ncbi:hypothetical protein, partial [Microbacterium phyllosphaerae]
MQNAPRSSSSGPAEAALAVEHASSASSIDVPAVASSATSAISAVESTAAPVAAQTGSVRR